jgi:hypothetical protein
MNNELDSGFEVELEYQFKLDTNNMSDQFNLQNFSSLVYINI